MPRDSSKIRRIRGKYIRKYIRGKYKKRKKWGLLLTTNEVLYFLESKLQSTAYIFAVKLWKL